MFNKQFISKTIVNLSNKLLNDAEKLVLSKG